MKTLEIERGKTIAAPFHWVDFAISNPDIQARLNHTPLQAKRLPGNRFLLTIFRVNVVLEEVHHLIDSKEGSLKLFADIRLPWGLGKTHTMVHYAYRPIDEETTSIDLSISIELTSFLMRLYAGFMRGSIDHYLNTVCRHTENAAKLLSRDDKSALASLDEEQLRILQAFRVSLPSKPSRTHPESPTLEGALRVVTSAGSLMVTAEARMPDRRILTANGRCEMTPDERETFCHGMMRAAGINNRALAVRGAAGEPSECADFRQAALELGYRFYRKICAEQLNSVLPVITSIGAGGALRISLEGEAEHLPWEAMHDGHEFLCIKTRMSRCVTTIQAAGAERLNWRETGVLTIGADARGDLAGVETEAKGIAKTLAGAGMARVEVLTGRRATRRGVIKALQSGQFGIMHFSGHSEFDVTHPHQSFLELCEGTRIFLHELGHFGHSTTHGPPLGLVFLNSCQSAKVGCDSLTGRQLSMCKALRESGVSYVIGMLWNVEDEAAVQVGSVFYSNLINSPEADPEGAMRETRLAVAMDRAWEDGSWLAPVLYT